jgi:hypothetical protein
MKKMEEFVGERVPKPASDDIWMEVAKMSRENSALNFGMGK